MIRPRILAVSPHLDDAALSAGATLAQAGRDGADVHVCTLFTAIVPGPLSDAATRFHRNSGLPSDDTAARVRQAEDHVAMQQLGATVHHGGLLDAVYRRQPTGEWLCQHERAMFDHDLPAEPDLCHTVYEAVAQLALELRPVTLMTCAAIGDHIDHRITRQVVTAVAQGEGIEVLFWEDLPYAISTDLSVTNGHLIWQPSEEAWNSKWQAIACYTSQTRMLWPAGPTWRQELETHARTRGDGYPAELFWPRYGRPTAAGTPARRSCAIRHLLGLSLSRAADT